MRANALVFFAAAGLLLLAACADTDAQPQQQAAKPVPVAVATVGRALDSEGALVSGTVRARQEASLAFVVAGRVTRILVNEGDRVAAGQLLAQLDMVEVNAGMAASRAEQVRAEAELARQRELFAKGWVTKARVESAEAAASAARSNSASRGFAQRYARITAPGAGVVLARSAEPGQIVAAGTPVLTVSQADEGLVLRVAVTDSQLAALRVGQVATVQLPALGNKPMAARVIELGGRGDARTGTFEAELALPPLAGLRSGMIGEARLPATDRSGALEIPASAVFQARAGEAFVYVVDGDNKANVRRITTGRVDNRAIEVLSGLSPGEKVVSKGLSRIRAGVTVAPQPDSAP
ncbi:MAG: efflux RND transporter periplasmic adaptor subunit [Sphingopyxis sp.]|nr:efflux RND transporter periplasmic adaptor subunit [Sphingopyxis sp.]